MVPICLSPTVIAAYLRDDRSARLSWIKLHPSRCSLANSSSMIPLRKKKSISLLLPCHPSGTFPVTRLAITGASAAAVRIPGARRHCPSQKWPDPHCGGPNCGRLFQEGWQQGGSHCPLLFRKRVGQPHGAAQMMALRYLQNIQPTWVDKAVSNHSAHHNGSITQQPVFEYLVISSVSMGGNRRFQL